MKSKGMVYTTFAIIATSMLILLVSFTAVDTDYTSDINSFRIGQASFYFENVQEDYNRAFNMAFKRGTTGVINYIVLTGNSLENPEKALRDATVNGSVNGLDLNNTRRATLSNWANRVEKAASSSKYRLNIEYREMKVTDNYFILNAGLKTFFTLKDPVTRARFNQTKTYTTQLDISGLEDPMMLLRTDGFYTSTFERCSFKKPAVALFKGQKSNQGAVYGMATVNPSDLDQYNQSERKKRILVVNDIQNYNKKDVEEFAGALSEQKIQQEYNLKYIFGIDQQVENIVENGESLILEEKQVWNAHFRQIMKNKCYLKSTGPQAGPGFVERTQNQLTSTENQGLVTVVNGQELPEEVQKGSQGSNVGYVLFQDAGNFGGLSSIVGVTDGEATGYKYYPAFRLDKYHIKRWGLSSLAPEASEVSSLSKGLFYVKNNDLYFLSTSDDTTKIVYDGSRKVQVLGPQNQDYDGDKYYEVPFVTDTGELKIVDSSRETATLASNARVKKSIMSINQAPEKSKILYAGENSDKIFKVSIDAAPREVADPGDGVNAVLGIADIDLDNNQETVFIGASQTIQYIGNGGVIRSTGQGVGSNNGLGAGLPYDFDGDGKARIPIVDGSNNVALVDHQGNKKLLTENGPARKTSIAVIDIEPDNRKEIAYIGKDTGKARYIDHVLGNQEKQTIQPVIKPDNGPGVLSRVR